MRFKWQLVPKRLFLLIVDVEHKLFWEGILQVQFLVHYGRLVHLQSSARHAVSNKVFRCWFQNVDESDSVGDFHLDGEDAIHCRIWWFSQHNCLRALFNGQITRISPKITAVIGWYADALQLCLVFPEKWQSLIGIERDWVAGLGLANFDEQLGGIGKHVLRRDFDDSCKLADTLVFQGLQVGVESEHAKRFFCLKHEIGTADRSPEGSNSGSALWQPRLELELGVG